MSDTMLLNAEIRYRLCEMNSIKVSTKNVAWKLPVNVIIP